MSSISLKTAFATIDEARQLYSAYVKDPSQESVQPLLDGGRQRIGRVHALYMDNRERIFERTADVLNEKPIQRRKEVISFQDAEEKAEKFLKLEIAYRSLDVVRTHNALTVPLSFHANKLPKKTREIALKTLDGYEDRFYEEVLKAPQRHFDFGATATVGKIETATGSFAVKRYMLPALQSYVAAKEEYTALISLRGHPNIIEPIHIMQAQDKKYMLILEDAGNCSLENLLTYQSYQSIESCINILSQVALGVRHIHDNGFVHGDIKTDNIMVTANFKVKIIDFCTAFRKDSYVGVDPIQSKHLAPEYRNGSDTHVDPSKIDIWSFGVLVYHMLTANGLDGIDNISEEELKAHLQLQHRVNLTNNRKLQSLFSIMKNCLSMNPLQRPSAEDICERFNALTCLPESL